jgi:hypothetical protein
MPPFVTIRAPARGAKGTPDQRFVVAVGACRVEDRDAGVEGRCDRRGAVGRGAALQPRPIRSSEA